MGRRIRDHIRSNIVGYVAIFMFAIGGTAYATHPGGDNTIDSGDIINQQVLQPDIAAEAVGTDQIKNNQVRSPDIKTGEVQTSDVLDETLGAVDLAPNSVGTSEVTDGTVSSADIASDTIQQVDLDNNVIASAEVINGSLTGDDVSDGTIGQADLAPREGVNAPTLASCDGVNDWITNVAVAVPVGFWKDRSGVVHLQGGVGCPGNATEGGAIFTLPAGYQPATQGGVVRWLALTGGATGAQIAVLDFPSGIVVYDGPDSASNDDYISLDGLTFRAEQ